jgi:protein-S-isoprenylcysteine O-methyltransferase Ste14
MRLLADTIATLVLLAELPVPLFWLLIHPRINFWRRRPRAWYYGTGLAVWLLTWACFLIPHTWWLEKRFGWHVWMALAGAALVAADVWLIHQAERQAGWRILVGLPELRPPAAPGAVVSAGIYRRLRHPRYGGMMLAWWGAVLLMGATRPLVLVLVFTLLTFAVMELEERELLARLGEAYARYRRQVPRLIPSIRTPVWARRGEREKTAE